MLKFSLACNFILKAHFCKTVSNSVVSKKHARRTNTHRSIELAHITSINRSDRYAKRLHIGKHMRSRNVDGTRLLVEKLSQTCLSFVDQLSAGKTRRKVVARITHRIHRFSTGQIWQCAQLAGFSTEKGGPYYFYLDQFSKLTAAANKGMELNPHGEPYPLQ